MEVARHVQSTQNRKVMLLQYLKKKVLQLLFSSIVMQKFQVFYGDTVILLMPQKCKLDSSVCPVIQRI